MRALIIRAEEKAALNVLRKFAESHRIDVDELLDIYNGHAPPVGDRKGFDCDIPVGYRVVFCIEHQTHGWARHLSVSIHPVKPHICANPFAVDKIMAYLGFQGKMTGENAVVYFENKETVVNVIEYIKEDDNKKK